MRERQKLSDLLQKKFKETLMSKRAQARNDVVLRLAEIEEQLQKGWSLRAMWKVLKESGELGCAYSTFVKHVQALRNGHSDQRGKKTKEFSWNPVPDKNDLI
jgi:hypothetical protein